MKSDRYEIFAREYVIDMNGTRAAIAAGYSEATAAEQASRLLTKVKIREQVDKLLSKRASRLDVKADKVIEELSRLAFTNMNDFIRVQDGDAYVDLSAMTRDQAAAIQEVTVDEYTEGRGEDKRDIKRVKIKLHDKRGSLELLGKNLKMFTDKVEHSGTIELAGAVEKARARANG